MSASGIAPDDDLDAPADAEIAACLNLESPRSFFLFAGAGSGKTRSLVEALLHIRRTYGAQLRVKGQRVAVITYTNAACDEITRRIDFDPVVVVRTIHSFAWSVVEGFNKDIREWLRKKMALDIRELEAAEAKGRAGSKASATRQSQIASKKVRLQKLDTVKKFTYNPNGDNKGRDTLNHSEVIQLVSHFIQNKPVMQDILANGYPIILVDESQDTNKHLVDALFALQRAHSSTFLVGLLGDMMQRIYSDGKEGLGTDLPSSWATPKKQLNHRSPKRIVSLINKIRSNVDHQSQQPRSDSTEGLVRMFVLRADTADKPAAERIVAQCMAKLTGDTEWNEPGGSKRLILEHRMAARRMGFLEMFVPLFEVDDFRTGLLDGTLSITRFFSHIVLPLVRQRDNKFSVAKIIRAVSPLITVEKLRESKDQPRLLREAQAHFESLLALWKDGTDPTFAAVLENVANSGLLPIPDSLQPSAFRHSNSTVMQDEDHDDSFAERAKAIDSFLATPFSQIEPYAAYVGGTAPFDTHQGVKGLEFPRVMVIMDDTEARGFLFKYEKLFGAGEDTSIDSTRRLFYVTCSRAQKSLALVAYSSDPERVRQHVVREGWFHTNEIQVGLPSDS
jgi:DNA helicase II / ATP-dependent DNA helicase PcrA